MPAAAAVPSVRGLGAVVTWEMPDGTQIRYLGTVTSDAGLREFVLRFMAAEGMSWDAAMWDERLLEIAFLRRFGETVRVTRERMAGRIVFVLHPVMTTTGV